MGPEKIAQKPWVYTLFRLADVPVVLSVLYGQAAMYDLNIPLARETAARAISDEAFLEKYASDIRGDPGRYAHLCVRM